MITDELTIKIGHDGDPKKAKIVEVDRDGTCCPLLGDDDCSHPDSEFGLCLAPGACPLPESPVLILGKGEGSSTGPKPTPS